MAHIKNSKESKRRLKQFRKTRSAQDREEYIEVKKKYNCLIKFKKREFKRKQAETLSLHCKNSVDFWKEVRSFGGDGKSRVKNDITLEEWHVYFKEVFSEGVNVFDASLVNDTCFFEEPEHVLNATITEDEVIRVVKKLSLGKSSGADNILAEMLKTGGMILITFMTKLFNTIFDTGTYPSKWSKAIVVPIYKKVIQTIQIIIDLYRF
jgi:hypothetical protein